MIESPPIHRPGRVAELDAARSLALVAMAVFHFVFDLELFGYVAPGTTAMTGWRWLALLTAGSFLGLAGVSLWLAHGGGIAWRGFLKRLLMVGGAAALISLVTVFAVPDAFIFFGILHSIALCSVLGLLALRLPDWAVAGLALAVFWIAQGPGHQLFNTPVLWWTGLQTVPLRSVDYVPIFPWFGPFLIGLALAKAGDRFGLWQRLAARNAPTWLRRFGFAGRHSLIVYLLHQPVLIALIWLAGLVMA